jgi:hypothetical protein
VVRHARGRAPRDRRARPVEQLGVPQAPALDNALDPVAAALPDVVVVWGIGNDRVAAEHPGGCLTLNSQLLEQRRRRRRARAAPGRRPRLARRLRSRDRAQVPGTLLPNSQNPFLVDGAWKPSIAAAVVPTVATMPDVWFVMVAEEKPQVAIATVSLTLEANVSFRSFTSTPIRNYGMRRPASSRLCCGSGIALHRRGTWESPILQ